MIDCINCRLLLNNNPNEHRKKNIRFQKLMKKKTTKSNGFYTKIRFNYYARESICFASETFKLMSFKVECTHQLYQFRKYFFFDWLLIVFFSPILCISETFFSYCQSKLTVNKMYSIPPNWTTKIDVQYIQIEMKNTFHAVCFWIPFKLSPFA